MHVGECRCVNVYSYLHASNINQEQFSPDFKSISKLQVFLFSFLVWGGGRGPHRSKGTYHRFSDMKCMAIYNQRARSLTL